MSGSKRLKKRTTKLRLRDQYTILRDYLPTTYGRRYSHLEKHRFNTLSEHEFSNDGRQRISVKMRAELDCAVHPRTID